MLALNIVHKSSLELLQPLDYNQGAPIGFLMLEKVAVHAFGNNEYALRLFPFLSGIISLFLFYEVAKRCIKPKALPIALGLFAISGPLISYSVVAKQYSSDVTIALLIYLVTIYIIQSERLTVLRITLFGVLGAIAILFSHPSVFILAGSGVSLTLFCLSKRDWARIGSFSIVYLLWALSFLAFYFVFLSDLSKNDHLLNYWRGNFMPFPPSSFSDVRWFVNKFFEILKDPVGLSSIVIAALTFIFGCITMYLDKKERFLMLISPALFALLASGFHKYPFGDRLLLFIIPSILLIIAEGTGQIMDNRIRRNSIIIGIVIIGLLFSRPLFSACHDLIRPSFYTDIKPIMNYVKENQRDGDVIYIYHGARFKFQYYSEKYGYEDKDYIIGIKSGDNLSNYINDLDKLRGNKRVWMIFSHYKWKGIDEKKFLLDNLDSTGIRLDSFEVARDVVYLYDLSGETSKPDK